MRKQTVRKIIVIALLVCLATQLFRAPLPVLGEDTGSGNAAGAYDEIDISGKCAAPPLDGGRDWFNVPKPLTLEQLRGKIVILDFWTYCCINCMHVMADMKKLEAKYPRELVIIGVHSAKFTNEKDSARIRQAVLRHDIEHPVVNDADFKIWEAYQASGWPHFAIIDPEGQLVGVTGGEGKFELFDALVKRLIAKFKDGIKPDAITLDLEKNKEAATSLRFPGKVFADADSRRLFIADSRNHRILVCDFAGKIQERIGTGQREPGEVARDPQSFFRRQEHPDGDRAE